VPASSRWVALILVTGVLGCGSGNPLRHLTLDAPGLDPERYRPEIATIEAILYSDTPLGEAGRAQLAGQLSTLAKKVQKDPSWTPISKVLGWQLGKMPRLVKATDPELPVGSTPLRHQWASIRASLFEDASWFRRSSKDPIAPAVTAPSPQP
jgi:hypothetical protein